MSQFSVTNIFSVHHFQHHTHPIIVSEESPERLRENVFYNLPFFSVQNNYLSFRFTFLDAPDGYSGQRDTLRRQPQRSCYIRGTNSPAPRQCGTAQHLFFLKYIDTDQSFLLLLGSCPKGTNGHSKGNHC